MGNIINFPGAKVMPAKFVLASRHPIVNKTEFRIARLKCKFSQASLAKLFGVGVRTIGRWENHIDKNFIPGSAGILMRLILNEVEQSEVNQGE